MTPGFLRYFLAALVGTLALRASSALPVVEVSNVNFRTLRSPFAANATWYEVDIALDARPTADHPGRMLPRVRVMLTLATEAAASAVRREYYRAEAELVALGTGRQHVRFYLPPEIVKRDALRGSAREWLVELTVGGTLVAPTPGSAAPALKESSAAQAFRTKSAAGAPANDGLLQPQYFTPFANEYGADTPTFVRRA